MPEFATPIGTAALRAIVHSVLFPSSDDRPAEADRREPAYFIDLNLDQVVAALTEGREEYDLAPFFHARLGDVDAIAYRHEVFRDLGDDELSAGIEDFAAGMREMRRRLAQSGKLRHRHQKQSWFLDAVDTYRATVVDLGATLKRATLDSRALTGLRDRVLAYAGSDEFAALTADIDGVRRALASVHCCLTISDGAVRVTRYDGEADYGAEVLAAFEKFKQAEVKDRRVTFSDYPDMNHVEEAVLDRIALLYPDVFATLDDFCRRHRDHVEETIGVFDREVQFYLAYRAYTGPLRQAGLPFCYPHVTAESKQILARDTFDLALAAKLVRAGTPVIRNDFHLDGPERIIVVSGPNQGGKTTFARMFGQLHHLAALGCPVPGEQTRLYLCDQIFTHFERGENLADLSGKLHDDLVRVHAILDQATDASVVIMNEVFTSTTLQDALVLGTRVLRKLIELDLLCVCVTFVEELASLGDSTVSMVSTVVPDDPATRTYRVIRRPADGLSYAMALADKYGITYERLMERIGRPDQRKAAS